MIKIQEKPSNIKDLTKRIQKIYHMRDSAENIQTNNVCLHSERINPKLHFAIPFDGKHAKNKILDEFEHLDNKLENVNQKIDNEIRRQANSLDKMNKPTIKNTTSHQGNANKKSLKLKSYNSFSCVSDQGNQKVEEFDADVASEKYEVNNTFQIENIDYEQFKSNLDKEIEETSSNKQTNQNLNFEQISEIKE